MYYFLISHFLTKNYFHDFRLRTKGSQIEAANFLGMEEALLWINGKQASSKEVKRGRAQRLWTLTAKIVVWNRRGEKWGSEGLYPKKFKDMPFRIPEMPPLQYRIKIIVFIRLFTFLWYECILECILSRIHRYHRYLAKRMQLSCKVLFLLCWGRVTPNTLHGIYPLAVTSKIMRNLNIRAIYVRQHLYMDYQMQIAFWTSIRHDWICILTLWSNILEVQILCLHFTLHVSVLSVPIQLYNWTPQNSFNW